MFIKKCSWGRKYDVCTVSGKFDVAVISTCVVLIKVSHQNCKKTMKTYAMLDNCSQGSFIKQELLKRLGADGQKLSVNLKTPTGEKSEEALMVDNVKVAVVNNMNDCILLPKVYLKKTLPVEKEEVATPEKVSKWKYLDLIMSEITQTNDIEIGMLLGSINILKIVTSKDGGPYACQTKLGWCIVGPMQHVGHENSLKCNRVAVKDASTGKLSRHFIVENTDKDMSIEQMFEQMYYNDFIEKGTCIGKIDWNIEQLARDFWKFWMQAQGRMGTTMRCHCHSNRKVSKFQITEVKL